MCPTIAVALLLKAETSILLRMDTSDRGVALDDGYVALNSFAPGENSGFALAIRSGEIALNLGRGNGRVDCKVSLPTDYTEGWMHVLAFVDRENNKIGLCIDFGTIVTLDIPEDMRVSLDTQYSANIGQDGTGKYGGALPATVDEFMIFDGAFDQSDVTALEEYYGIANN